MNIVIVDDEPLARLRLRQLCEDLAPDWPNHVLAEFDSATAVMNGFLAITQPIHVLLLDVNMPGLDGLELAAYLRRHAPELAVVLVTAAAEHAVQAFEVEAVDFVLKPVRAERLLTSLKKAALRLSVEKRLGSERKTPASVLQLAVRGAQGEFLLSLSEVLYFKSDGRLTAVITQNAVYYSRQSLNELEAWLDTSAAGFVRIHRNTLLAKSATGPLTEGPQGLHVAVIGLNESLAVSRRMWASLRAQLIR